MSYLRDVHTDSLSLVKSDSGERYENVVGSIQASRIYINRADIPIESGDLFQKKDGTTFEVIDPGYVEEYAGMDSRYQVSICKLYADKSKKALDGVSFYVRGHNTQTDENLKRPQTTFVVLSLEVSCALQGLRRQFISYTTGREQEDAIQIMDAVEGLYKSGAASGPVISALLKALPTVGNVTTILAVYFESVFIEYEKYYELTDSSA